MCFQSCQSNLCCVLQPCLVAHRLPHHPLLERAAALKTLHAPVPQRLPARITLRKQTETQLRRNADRTRHLLRAANIGLWEWDLLTNEVYFSPEWKGQLGYADAEIPNRFDEWQQRVHPEDLKGALTAVDDFRSGRAPQYSVQIRLRHRDGSWRWIYGDAQIERNDDGVCLIGKGLRRRMLTDPKLRNFGR